MDSVRPRFHVVAPHGWMNDPCGPGFSPRTGTYHLFYQWNPKSTQWGDISWGQVASRDLVRWTHVGNEPMLTPSEPYDEGGIFTGCLHVADSGELFIIYTSATELPIHWTREHKRGSESVSIVTSKDGGKTWTRHAFNPIVSCEPDHLVVTGFRDPYVAPWPSMDTLLKTTTQSSNRLYGLISGGTKAGPTTFLYAIDRDDLTKWDYVGPLVDLPRHHRVETKRHAKPNAEDKWSANDLGCNWECTTFVTLRDDRAAEQRHVLLPSSEGGAEQDTWKAYHKSHPDTPTRTPRGANWMFGELSVTDSAGACEPRFTPTVAGLLDHGSLYACTIFPHRDGRTVLWGWAIEDDVTPGYLETKGWTGCLGLPREIFLLPLDDVVGTLHTPVERLSGIDWDGKRAVTLGIRPLPELKQLRSRALLNIQGPTASNPLIDPTSTSAQLEIEVCASITPSTTFTLHLKHDAKMDTRTSIVFSAASETLSVDRSASTRREDVNTMPDSGPFTLFEVNDSGAREYDDLRLRVFVDGDLIEVFANDRFALTTRTYAPSVGCGGMSLEIKGGGKVKTVKVWELGSIGLETGLERAFRVGP